MTYIHTHTHTHTQTYTHLPTREFLIAYSENLARKGLDGRAFEPCVCVCVCMHVCVRVRPWRGTDIHTHTHTHTHTHNIHTDIRDDSLEISNPNKIIELERAIDEQGQPGAEVLCVSVCVCVCVYV
jgi:hypothetical protein